jgi:inhibitor of KinA sporulation pathway (predicted exonuclease)
MLSLIPEFAHLTNGDVVVFDLEYTAWDGSLQSGWSRPGEHREIVAFGAVKLNNIISLPETDSFFCLVYPKINPRLSDYFTALTGIAQSDLDCQGLSLAEALQRFKDFIGSNSVVALSNGGDDDVIRENCILQGLEFHFSDQLFRNVRPIFAAATGLSDVGVDSCRLSAIFNLPESYRAHDPLDDARAIAGAIRSLIAAIPHIGFGSGMMQLSKPEAK